MTSSYNHHQHHHQCCHLYHIITHHKEPQAQRSTPPQPPPCNGEVLILLLWFVVGKLIFMTIHSIYKHSRALCFTHYDYVIVMESHKNACEKMMMTINYFSWIITSRGIICGMQILCRGFEWNVWYEWWRRHQGIWMITNAWVSPGRRNLIISDYYYVFSKSYRCSWSVEWVFAWNSWLIWTR